MNISKVIFVSTIALLVGLVSLAYVFYRQNRSALPALLPPKEDITKLIPPADDLSSAPTGQNTTGMPLKLPNGFDIGIFAKDLGKARDLELDISTSEMSKILVSIPDQGIILAFNVNNSATPITVATGLNQPHGIKFVCPDHDFCWLFVAETNQVTRFDYVNKNAKAINPTKIADLPTGGGHTTRSLDYYWTDPSKGAGRLLVSVGSSCNVCIEKDYRRAAILSMNFDGSDQKIFATGLRNTVFMAKHSATGELWGTDMGRDLIGDDIPPDEVNIISENSNYGWPICYGKNTTDTNFTPVVKFDLKCDTGNDFTNNSTPKPSHIDIPAHSAPLGLAFIPDDGPGGWPDAWKHDILVALHGSWNRSTPSGYKVVRYDLDDTGNVLNPSPIDFITGFLQSTNAKQTLGRPVDILTLPNGEMYVSDDKAGVIYRITINN